MIPFLRMTLLAALLYCPVTALAFPPVPSHLLFGNVKDEYGTPLMNSKAKVVLVASNGVQIATTIVPGLAIGVNFALEVPMDAGITSDLYKTNALLAAAPFKLYVVVGSTTNLPIQMTGGFTKLGASGGQTRLDLTLGTDSSGDGIPDAWKRAFLASLGLNLDIASLKSNVDYAHDGRTLLQEYLLGNYPFDPEDSFAVKIVDPNAGSPLLEFTTMQARSYTVFGSLDLQNWIPLSIQVPAEGTGTRASYYASDIRTVQVQVVQPSTGPAMRFFKLQLQ